MVSSAVGECWLECLSRGLRMKREVDGVERRDRNGERNLVAQVVGGVEEGRERKERESDSRATEWE